MACKKIFINVALASGAVLAAFLLLEAINLLLVINSENYFVWPPNLNKTFHPDGNVTYGISGESVFSINRLGYRGVLIENRSEEYRILAIGGSSTESLYLDNRETWPHLLMLGLNRTDSGKKVIVLNVGKAGQTSREHILELEHLSTQYDPDLVIIMMGVNDLMLNINEPRELVPKREDYGRTFYKSPEYGFTKTIAYRIGREIYARFFARSKVQDDSASVIARKKQKLLNSTKLQVGPDSEAALNFYSRNIERLVNVSMQKKVKLILVTQPSIWRENLSVREEGSLWLMADREGKHYSASVLAGLMGQYNLVLMEECERFSILCFDLASRIPKSSDNFYDDVHFNEGGAALVAREFEWFIRENGQEFSKPEAFG